MKRFASCFLFPVCCLLSTVCIAEENLDLLFADFFDAPTDSAIRVIVDKNPNAELVKSSLISGRKYSKDVPIGWNVWESLCIDSVKRPYHIYIPESYTPDKKYTVLFDLHGGVNRKEFIPEDDFTNRRSLWMDEAREKEFIYILPLGQRGATWWDEVGAQNILSILRYVKQKYNVDENKVFISGFSDGGSGSFYMALNYPTPFAGFIPLNGHISVAGAGGNPVYLPNLYNRPLYIVNTGKDQLYPVKSLMPYIDGICKTAREVTFKVYQEIGHTWGYKDKEAPFILEFMKRTERELFPSKLEWETASPEFGRVVHHGAVHRGVDWLKIEKIEDIGNNAEFEDINPIITRRKIIIGIYVDREFKGKGVGIEKIVKNTLADSLKLIAGDIIVGLDDKDIKEYSDLRKVLSKKKPGDHIKITILRNKKKLVFEGDFEPAEPKPAFNREKLSGRILAEVSDNRIDVKAKNIAVYTLFISDEQFDLAKDIEVYTNEELSFKGKVKPDIEFILRQYAEDSDRTRIYSNKIEIAVIQK